MPQLRHDWLMQSIWMVTTLAARQDKNSFKRTAYPRSWGYFFAKEQAIEGMHRCCDTECGYYTHAIIEEFEPGIYSLAKEELWFVWRGDTNLAGNGEWASCEKPETEAGTINYGLG